MSEPTETLDARSRAVLTTVLKSQYHAALAMLRETIERCPEDLWLDARPRNAFWQVAYHVLFFAHLYFGDDEASFSRWPEHQRENQNEDAIANESDTKSSLPLLPRPYSKDQVLRYWSFVDERIDAAVDALDLSRRDSGFSWYKMSKLELQLLNLRHIQHHAAQLADRLRSTKGLGTRWVGARPRGDPTC